MQLDLLYFIISGVSFIIAVGLFLFYFLSKPKTKRIMMEDLRTDKTKTMRHTATQDMTSDTELMEITDTNATELMNDDDLPYENSILIGTVLHNNYRIDRLLGRGGMGAVYLCTNLKIGNQWAIKHIFHSVNSVLAEEQILKRLNHINLPKIIDIFHDEAGTYIVESYIEGQGLDGIISKNEILNEEQLADWANQLSEVILYLHNLKPYPIIHRDLKPSNIIVTNENKLVLIDFGISKQYASKKDAVIAVSKHYAAPEQFQGVSDERSDIYSYGVIMYQIATRQLPNMPHYEALLKDAVSLEIANIILKCLKQDPNERYQNVEQLRQDLGKLRYSRIKNMKFAFRRKIALGIAAVFFIAAISTGGAGYYTYGLNNLSVFNVSPEVLYLTEQQTGEILIDQLMPGNVSKTLDNKYVAWEYSDLNVARVEDNKIIAMNVGETEILGRYRNKVLKMNVAVVKPDGMTDIKLKYNVNFQVSKFAGNGERELSDGYISDASMINPSSIDVAPDGTVYFIDGDKLRKISNGTIETIKIDPSYITPKVVKALSQDELYFITNEWQDEDGYFRGIVKISEGNVEGFYIISANENDILDMTFNSTGELYMVERDLISSKNYIKKFALRAEDPEVVSEISYGICSLTFDKADNLYLADKDKAVIYKYNKDKSKCDYFAGVLDNKNFIDGINARFYQPYKIKAYDNYIYVMDFNVLRRISIDEENNAFDVETVAGKAGLTSSDMLEGRGCDIIFEKSIFRDMTIDSEGNILITDPEKSIIRKIIYISPEGSTTIKAMLFEKSMT